MSDNKLLLNYFDKLGLQHPVILQKAEAFLRVLNSKGATTTVSDGAKAILCLDLAATSLGAKFDKAMACKLAVLKIGAYQNNLNNIEKILNLDRPISISELCVQLSCTEAKEMAEKILSCYKEQVDKIKDVTHPQYVAASVFASCKVNKIKVDKSKFKAISRLKTAQWNELAEEFVKFADSLSLSSTHKSPKKHTLILPEENELIGTEDKHVKKNEELIEDYEVWRERILKEASAEILKNEICS